MINLYSRKRLIHTTPKLDNCENEEDIHNIVTRKGNDINFHSDVTLLSFCDVKHHVRQLTKYYLLPR